MIIFKKDVMIIMTVNTMILTYTGIIIDKNNNNVNSNDVNANKLQEQYGDDRIIKDIILITIRLKIEISTTKNYDNYDIDNDDNGNDKYNDKDDVINGNYSYNNNGVIKR